MILTQNLIQSSTKYLTRGALRYLGKEINYKDFLAAISKLSYLYQHELEGVAEIRMAFYSRPSIALVQTIIAMTNIKAVVILLDPEVPPDELGKWIRDTKATHLAVSGDLMANARELVSAERLPTPIIEFEKKHGGEYDPSFTPSPERAPKESDPIFMFRTAGTTGKPKYIQFTHKQLNAAALAVKPHYHFSTADRVLTKMNFWHPFPFLHGLMIPLLNGVTTVLDHGLEAVEFLDFILDQRVTRLVGPPQFFFKQLVICKNEKRVLPGIKSITVGMGALSPELVRAFELLKVNVSHVYGMTENFWTIAMQDTQDPLGGTTYERGFVGKGLVGMKYKVMDDNGDEVEGKGRRVGQLAVGSPSVMPGYFEREKETKNALRGTWLYTGDIAALDGDQDDLKISYLGRKDDMIKVDGQLFSVSATDMALRAHPAIQDAATFVIKDGRGKPVVVCAVVRKVGAVLNEKQVLDFAAGKTEGPSPQAVAFTDVIPRDGGHNVNCAKLRAQFSGIAG